jgi:peptide/nickel transport system substrate-binding protein
MQREFRVTPVSRRGALALGAAAVLSARTAAAAGSTLRVALAAGVGSLDPAKFRVGGMETNYAACVFNRLTRLDTAMQVQPDLATSWEASPDLKSWTFHLHPDVTFHNGRKCTADDVVFTYRRLQDKTVASVMRAFLSVVSDIEAVDPLTVRFTLSMPYADLPAVTSGFQAMILCETTLDTLTTRPIGTGPFRFVEYRPGDRMLLERNPDYFNAGVPKVDSIVLQVMPENTTAVAALESGSVDVVYNLPPEQVERLSHNPAVRVAETASGNWFGIIMHNQMKPFDDPRVRQAIIKLVDKSSFTDIATFGHGTPTVSPIPPTHPYFRKDLLVAADIAGAKRLLAEAGLGDGLTLEMYIPGSSPPLERLATAFRDTAKQVGITVQLRIAPQDKFFAEMEGKVMFNADYFSGRPTPDLMLYAWYHSSGSWNNTLWHYSNSEVDRLLDEARGTTDTARQAKLYGRFQEIIAQDGPGCVVFVQNFACAVSQKVQNFTTLPLMLMDLSTTALAS